MFISNKLACSAWKREGCEGT